MNFIKRGWNGELKLRWIILLLILFVIIRIVYIAVGYYGHDLHTEKAEIQKDILLYFFLMLPYAIWLHVALWRSSSKLKPFPPSENPFNLFLFLLSRFYLFLSLLSYLSDVVRLED